MSHLKKLLLTLSLAALLCACGGGDEPDAEVGPPDCRNRPEICR